MKLEKVTQDRLSLVFQELHLEHPVLLGKGGEGWVFEYGTDALKIYLNGAELGYLQNIQTFQNQLATHNFTFAIPRIYQIGEVEGVLYTVEKRLDGIQMDKRIIGLGSSDRQRLYQKYYDAIRQVHTVTFPNAPFGQIIQTTESITADTWVDFLLQVFDQRLVRSKTRIQGLVTDFDKKTDLFKELMRHYLGCGQKSLVHSDYFLNNVLVNDDLDISAILDFSVHAVVGDPKLDIASVLTWNEIDPNVRPEDYMFLYETAKQDYGEDIELYADLYLLYSSFYFGDMDDPSFSVRALNNEQLWEKYR